MTTTQTLQRLTVYKTTDGKLYDHETEALNHELSVQMNEVERIKKELNEQKNKNQNLKAELDGYRLNQGGKYHGGRYLPPERQFILDSLPMESGVYMIINIDDNYKKYIGSSKSIRKRAITFFNFDTTYGGGESFEEVRHKFNHPSHWMYVVLELCPISELETREAYYIDLLDTRNNGYNISTARRNKKYDNDIKYKDKDIPMSFVNFYETFIHGRGGWGSVKDAKENIPLTDFYDHMKKIGGINKPEGSNLTMRIKSCFDKYKDKKDVEKISLIPYEVIVLINPHLHINEYGYPNAIKKIETGEEYMYEFFSRYSLETGIPTSKAGYVTKKEAYKGYLAAKTNIARYFIKKSGNCTDDETAELFKHITYKEAERLFASKGVKHVFDDEEGEEVVPEYN